MDTESGRIKAPDGFLEVVHITRPIENGSEPDSNSRYGSPRPGGPARPVHRAGASMN